MSALISITPPKKIRPLKMLKSVQSYSNNYAAALFDDLVLPEVPPRGIASLLILLESKKANVISLLEWITIFEADEFFYKQSKEKSSKYKTLIWSEIAKQAKVRQIAFWRICLYFDGQHRMMPSVLMNNFHNSIKPIKEIDKQRSLLLIALSENKANDIAYYTLQTSMTPKSLFCKLGLPNSIQLVQLAIEDLESILFSKGFLKYSAHYLKIIKSYSDIDRDQAVARLVKQSEKLQLGESVDLVKYLKNTYAPNVLHSRWNSLNLDTQRGLREVFGAAWFADFKIFIFQLTSPKLANALGLTDKDIRQLQSRVTFWSNYQSRFHSFKVFLPLKTSQTIKNSGLSLPEHSIVEGFSNSWKETELCLLEFDDHFVVEYLRGGSSSVKVYSKSDKEINSLLPIKKIRIDDLSSIAFLKDHDHLVYWQNSCEKMLRTEFGILPDDNLNKFLIKDANNKEDRFDQKYSSQFGLPKLSVEKVNKREVALLHYKNIMPVNSTDNVSSTLTNKRDKKQLKYGKKPENFFVGQNLFWLGQHRIRVTEVGSSFLLVKMHDGRIIQVGKDNDFR